MIFMFKNDLWKPQKSEQERYTCSTILVTFFLYKDVYGQVNLQLTFRFRKVMPVQPLSKF